jgi:hypothetical protein
MSEAILATFSEVKIIKTRSVMQIVCEIPIDQADEALRILGGIPQPAEERWVGIALSKPERKAITANDAQSLLDHKLTPGEVERLMPKEREHLENPEFGAAQKEINKRIRNEADTVAKQRRPFETLPLSQQAAIRSTDRAFWEWLGISGEVQAAEYIRKHCGVGSRAEINTADKSGSRWLEIESQFKAYLTDEKYAEVYR